MPSLLYLQTLCSVAYTEHEGYTVLSGLGVRGTVPSSRAGLHIFPLHARQQLQA